MSQDSRTSSIAYSGRVTSWWAILAGAIAVTVFIIVEGYYDPVSILIALVFIGGPYLNYTSVRTTAGRTGVVVRYGLFGLPRYRYLMGEIRRAEVIDIPRDTRRSSWRHPLRHRRLTIRRGPALQLELNDGRRVAITVEDPPAAAAVVNGYLGWGPVHQTRANH